MLSSLRRLVAFISVTAVAVGMVQIAWTPPATAVAAMAPPPGHEVVVSEAPTAWTPAVNNGSVRGFAQVDQTMVAVGDFSSVTPAGAGSVARNGAFAFNASTGALVSGFAPSFNGAVNAVLTGPTPGTVYVAGGFTQANGVSANRIALLNVSTGAIVSSFKTPGINGVVNSIERYGNRLYVGGNFTVSGGVAHGGLASFNATTGALDNYVSNQVSERHNDTGSGAQGAIGVRDLELTPDGAKLVAIGNFKKVDGLPRDQVVVVDLGGSSSVVSATWRTRRYEPYCYNWAFDTYVRAVSVAPSGDYFVVGSTGGHNTGTLCDTAARFEFSSSGDDVQPTWVNYSGGDTLWGIEATGEAVYVGGHQRWMNNSDAADWAGQGSVSRPGLAALDPDTGMPIKWNAARNPRGSAVYELHATAAGLWMGSDTEFVGPRYRYKRPRLAFFPVGGGSQVASDSVATLPGTAYLGAPRTQNLAGNILYRVNAGGPTLGSVDAGPDWVADETNPSPYRNDGSNAAGWSPGATTDSTVPAGTPNAVFDTERWSPGDDPSLQWAFPAQNGVPLQVRLYFANRYGGTSGVGQRVFDVKVEGATVLDNFDIVSASGADQRGTMRAFNITSDGTVNIELRHEVENPLINAIEIVRTDQAPPTEPGPTAIRSVDLSQGGVDGVTTLPDPGIDFTQWRGAFLAGGKVWYGKSNGTFNSRSFEAGAFGPEVNVNPYDDPDWDGVSTGSGNTYDGNAVAMYGQLSSVSSMAYVGGRLFYTRSGNSNLFWRWFSTDSGIIGSQEFTANAGRSWTGTTGMFATSTKLYFVASDGTLNSIGLAGGVPSGGTQVVDGPTQSGVDWRARALFFGPSTAQPPNADPTASFTSSCVDLICSFDASASEDSDGTIESFDWDFGPGSATGQTAQHSFGAAGTYNVTLSVTDDRGGVGSVTRQVTVEVSPQPADPITFVDSAVRNANTATPTVTIPAGVQAGDLLLLTASVNNAPSVTTPAGWTLVETQSTTGLSSYVYSRVASGSDAGANVPVALSSLGKSSLALSVYRNASAVSATATSVDAGTANHGAPEVTVPTGSWVVWFWAEKSAGTSALEPGVGVSKRAEVYSTGSGRVAALVGDTNGPRAGVVPGAVAVADTVSSRGLNWSIVLQPASN